MGRYSSSRPPQELQDNACGKSSAHTHEQAPQSRHVGESVNDPQYRFGIAEADYFHKTIEKSRTVKNMMNDADIVETVNTPGYMSPRSEAYWSM